MEIPRPWYKQTRMWSIHVEIQPPVGFRPTGILRVEVVFAFDDRMDRLAEVVVRKPDHRTRLHACEGVDRRLDFGGINVVSARDNHVASAIADRLGSRLLPSIPSLAMGDAAAELETFIERVVGGEAPRIESRLEDEDGHVIGRLVLIPTR